MIVFFFLLKERLTLPWFWFSGYFSKVYISGFFVFFNSPDMWCFQSWILTSYKSQKWPLIHRVLFGLRSSPKKHPGPCASALQSPGMWGRVLLILGLQLISHISPPDTQLASLEWVPSPPHQGYSLQCLFLWCSPIWCLREASVAGIWPPSHHFWLFSRTGLWRHLQAENHGVPFVGLTRTTPGRRGLLPNTHCRHSDDWSSWAVQAGPEGLVLPQCSIHAILREGGLPWRIKAVASTEPWLESQSITVPIGIIHSSVLFQSLGRMS